MYIAIDVGGTNIRIAYSENIEEPKLLDIKKVKVLNDYDLDIKIIIDAITKINPNPNCIGFSIAGRLNAEKTIRISKGNLTGWYNAPIVDDLVKQFKCPVKLENDAACAALGEAYYGSGENRSFIYLIWGTGVGGTEIKNLSGKVEYYPMEPGHEIILEDNGRTGSCGHQGDLESYTGGKSIEMHYGKSAKELSEEEWDEVTTNFAHGITELIKQRPADLIIFGGGVGINQKQRINQIQEKLKNQLGKKAPILVQSKLGDDAGLYGSLALLRCLQDKNISGKINL